MNFFNEIDKVTYKKENQDPIQLIEYIKFKDEKSQEKYLIFKFRNNLNQIASAMKLEVKQFDEDNNLIEKTVFSYDNFKAKAQEIFVPTAKLKANYNTSYIEAKLLYASFESIWWNGEALLPIVLTEDEIKKEYINPLNDEKDNKPISPKRQKNNTSGARKTKYKDITKSNKPKLPKVLTVLLTLALLAVSVYFIFRLRLESKYIHDSQFEYEIIDSDEAKIINYMGNNLEVTIPSKFKKYDIIAVDKEAFKDSSIRILSFKEGKMNIATSAFEGCMMLEEINDEFGSVKNVAAKAFKDCQSLKVINLPNAVISASSFENCSKVTDINASQFFQGSIFSAFNISITLNTLEIKQEHISNNFFLGINSLYTLILGGNACVDVDALNNIALKNLKIDKLVTVKPECLSTFTSLTVELNKDNAYKQEDYLAVNPNLNILTWFIIGE